MTNSNDNKSNPSLRSTGSQIPNNDIPAQRNQAHTPRAGRSNDPSVSKLGNKNALVHGVHSKHILLAWESEDELKKLHQDFRNEWKPNGCSEEHAVWDLTHNTWLKLRLLASTQLRLSQSTIPEDLKNGELTLDDMLQHQAKAPKHASGALASVNGFIKELDDVFETIRSRKWPDTDDGRQVRDALHLQQRDVSTLIEKTKEKVVGGVEQLVEVVQRSTTRFEQSYQTDEIEKQLDLLAKIDARTEKILRRLTSLKEYKRIAKSYSDPPTVVESPSLMPGETSTTDASSEDNDTSEVTLEHRGSGKKD